MNVGAPHGHVCTVASLLLQLPISALAIDVTHIDCGRDGRAHLVAVIDRHDREIVGYEFPLRGRAKEAERGNRALLPQLERGVRVAAQLQEFR